jgi:dipeptidyl-peptidase-4
MPRPPGNRRSLAAACLLAWTAGGAAGLRPARADDPPASAPPLSVETIFAAKDQGGVRYTKPLLDGAAWRPGHSEWTVWEDDPPQDETKKPAPKPPPDRVLVAVDAVSGTKKRLLARSEFREWLEGKNLPPEVPMDGIGRAAPPSLLWSDDGDLAYLAWRGDLYLADLRTGKRARLTSTKSTISDVRLAPSGHRLCFARDHDLWALDVAEDGTSKELRLTTGGSDSKRNAGLDWLYPEELDAKTGAWWSPDSSRVAFLALDETKVPRHAIVDSLARPGSVTWEPYPTPGDANPVPRVGVVGLDGRGPVWLDLGPVRDVYVPWVAWHPDGKRVFVAILDRSQTKFELRLCDAEGNGSTTFLREEDSRWVDVPPPPRFLTAKDAPPRDAFVWTSRRDGWWRHWYVPLDAEPQGAIPKDGLAMTPEGRDAGPVLAIDQKHGLLYYEQTDAERHQAVVMQAHLAGVETTALTRDDASHHASFSDDALLFIDRFSRATVAPKAALRRADGTSVRDLGDSDTPELRALGLRPPEFLKIPGADGKDLPAMLWKPADFDPSRRYPVVIHTYGGPGARVVNDSWGGGGGLFTALLLREGFLVFLLDNRGSGGRGKDFEAQVHRRLGTLELEDQVRGAKWLQSQPFVAPDRIGIWGWSYGGYMTCLAMTRAPDVFRAGVAVAPVTDWRLYDTIYTERYMDLPSENEAGYRDSAPVRFAKDLKGALLLCHGLCDDNVHVQNSLRLQEEFLTAKRPFDLMLYPSRAHGIEGESAHVDLFRRILEHFRRRR